MKILAINLPKVESAGNDFLFYNRVLTPLILPELTQVGDGFLFANKALSSLSLPKLTQVGDQFICRKYGDYFPHPAQGNHSRARLSLQQQRTNLPHPP